MHDSPLSLLWLCAAAFLGGAINAVAGGGTLLTFPALLAILNPVAANATSTLALFPGSLAGAWGYRRELAEVQPMLARLWLPSLIGGVIGSLAVTRFPEKVFESLVPWLLLAASTLMLLQKPIMRWIGAHPHAEPAASTAAAVVFFQLLVGIYGGYFGAGIGILMLSSLSLMGIGNVHRMNALKTILAATMNGATVAVFMFERIIIWKYALIMAAAAIAGGYLGARGARRLSQKVVRGIVLVIGFSVSGYYLYRKFLG
ncbi:MAG: sulfite exporter TauE/SafE family protein [Bryobacterales bacterium]|nr:sulfite exporter TauE/SafE family protein [Bryobacterales bacterium]